MDSFVESAKNYDYIRLLMADLYGIARGKIVHTSHAEHVIHGCSIYAGTVSSGPQMALYTSERITGRYSNVLIKGDPTTLREIPWAGQDKFRVAAILGESYWNDGMPQLACPRFVARQQLKRLEKMGLKLKSSFEAELNLLNSDNQPVFDDPDYLDMNVTSDLEPFLLTLDSQMRKAGVDLEGLHSELAPGQFEAIQTPSWGIRTADDKFLLHAGAKEIAKQFGYKVCSLSEASDKIGGTGSHFNFSVWDANTGKSIFSDIDAENKLSDFAKHWMAGLVTHTGAITALCCPTVNCYRRLHQFVVPTKADWDIDNRTVTYRVKNGSPAGTYFENRLPSALSNPYIVMAATIAAGLDGVERKLACPPGKDEDAKSLVNSLTEAVKDLEEDSAMKSALGEEFVDWFVGCKKSIDLKKLKDHDKDAEDQDERRKQEMNFYLKSM